MKVTAYDRLRDSFLIRDPGLFRLRNAVRGTIAVVAATALLYAIRSDSRPFLLSLVGALMVMTGALSTDDRTIREQKITALLIPPAAALSLALGALVLQTRPAAVALLLVFTYGAIAVRKFGVRWNTLGGIAYVSFFSAIFFKVPVEQMLFVVEGIVLSGIISYVVKFYIVPDRAQSAIAWSLSAYRAGLRRFARAAYKAMPLKNRESIRHAMVRVNELALLSEDAILNAADANPKLAGLVRTLQGRVFDLELSARKIFESFEQRDQNVTENDLRQLLEHSLALKSDQQALVAEDEAASPALSLSPTADTVTGTRKVRYTSLQERLHPQTRQAIQATLATAIATVIGSMISTDRWYWAPLTAYVIFTGTTRGDSLRRALHRLAGTACGVAAGLFIAYLLHGDRTYELAALFVAMFLGIFSIKGSYYWYVFFLTTLIALFYNVLGLLTPGLLYLRIEQTLIGGLCGAVCAFLVLPVRSQLTLRRELSLLFSLLAESLHQTASSHAPRRERRVRVRTLERELLTLRAIAGPLKGPLGRPVREETRIVVHGAAALVHYARQLVVFFPAPPMGDGLANEAAKAMRSQVEQLSVRAQALSNAILETEFVDMASPQTGGERGETWANENPPDPEAPTYVITRLAQSISAFETRFPAKS